MWYIAAGGSSPDTLLQVGVPLVTMSQCNAQNWYGGSIDSTMICAGYEEGGRDSCQVGSDDGDRWVVSYVGLDVGRMWAGCGLDMGWM